MKVESWPPEALVSYPIAKTQKEQEFPHAGPFPQLAVHWPILDPILPPPANHYESELGAASWLCGLGKSTSL